MAEARSEERTEADRRVAEVERRSAKERIEMERRMAELERRVAEGRRETQ